MANDKQTAAEKAQAKEREEEQRKVASARAAEGEANRRLAEEKAEAEREQAKADEHRVIVRELPKKDVRGAVTANDPGPVEATGVILDDGTFSQGQIINEPPAGLGPPEGSTARGRPTGEGSEFVEPGKEIDLPPGFSFQGNHAQRRQKLLDLVEDMKPEDALYTLAGKVATAEMLLATVAVKNGGWASVNVASAQRNNKVVDIPSTVGPDSVLIPVAQDMEAPVQVVFNLAERVNRG